MFIIISWHYFSHPLFPLLSMLFEKCEMATKSIDLNASFNFNMESQKFVEQTLKEKSKIICEDNEVNELVSYRYFDHGWSINKI